MPKVGILQRLAQTPIALRGMAIMAAGAFWLTVATTLVGAELLSYRSPFETVFSSDGALLAVSDRTADRVTLIDTSARKVLRDILLDGPVSGLAWGGDRLALYAAEYEKDAVVQIDGRQGTILRRLPVGSRPLGLALAPRKGLLLAANSAGNDVSVVTVMAGKELKRIRVARQPFSITITPDESLALVSNFLPAGSALDIQFAAVVTLIDLKKLSVLTDIRLPPGSMLVRQTAVSPDGRWAYVVHALARFTVPVTQLERSWVNGNALSIIDLSTRQLYATVLLDQLFEAATEPWGVRLSRDGSTLWTSLAGVHQVLRVNVAGLHRRLAGQVQLQRETSPPADLWHEIQRNPQQRALLINDLEAMTQADLITRISLPGKGPRGIDLSPNGQRLAVAAYYSSQVFLVDTKANRVTASIPLGTDRAPDPVRWGEMIFNDATYSVHHWLSCGTCHPDGRVDAVNWDLTNDGLGNPKNTRSLLYSHRTPPVMSLGIRSTMEVAALAGFRGTLGRELAAEEIEAVQAYIRSLKPERSPLLLPNGDLSPKARQGKAIFDSPKTRCSFCHSGPLFTDLRLRNVGTGQGQEEKADFDTPTLVELWRTAPYLHHGGAATLQEVFTRYNPLNRHGVTSHLTAEEMDALVEYLLSL